MTAKQPQPAPEGVTRPDAPAAPPDRLRQTLAHYQGLLDHSNELLHRQRQLLNLRETRIDTLEGIVHKLARDRFLLDWLESMQVQTMYCKNGVGLLIGDDQPLREALADLINQGAKQE